MAFERIFSKKEFDVEISMKEKSSSFMLRSFILFFDRIPFILSIFMKTFSFSNTWRDRRLSIFDPFTLSFYRYPLLKHG